jgi:hypothetical protein
VVRLLGLVIRRPAISVTRRAALNIGKADEGLSLASPRAFSWILSPQYIRARLLLSQRTIQLHNTIAEETWFWCNPKGLIAIELCSSAIVLCDRSTQEPRHESLPGCSQPPRL